MKFNNEEFTEIAFIFEKENNYKHSEFEENTIQQSQLKNVDIIELEKKIIYGINNAIYLDNLERISAYWALSKRNNYKLIPKFRIWLKKELESEIKNSIPIYQILIALDALGENVFSIQRLSRDSTEFELNIDDAKKYLK